jgi:hypothetical protein
MTSVPICGIYGVNRTSFIWLSGMDIKSVPDGITVSLPEGNGALRFANAPYLAFASLLVVALKSCRCLEIERFQLLTIPLILTFSNAIFLQSYVCRSRTRISSQ